MIDKSCKSCAYASDVFFEGECSSPCLDRNCINCSFWETVFFAYSLCGEYKRIVNKEDLMIWEL